MAIPSSDEIQIMPGMGNFLEYSDMAKLSDGRFVSIGHNAYDIRIRIHDPIAGTNVTVPDLTSDYLRGAPRDAITRVLHQPEDINVAALSDGGFVVAVNQLQNINGSFSNYEQVIYLQYYNADGSLRGAAVRGRNPTTAGGTDAGTVSTSHGGMDIVETPEGVVLLFRQTTNLNTLDRPGLVARFFDNQGNLVADRVLFTDRSELPAVTLVEGDELLFLWQATRDTTTRPTSDQPPAGLYVQKFALDGTPLTTRDLLEGVAGINGLTADSKSKLLTVSDNLVKLIYLSGFNSVNAPLGLVMQDLNGDGQPIGAPVTLLDLGVPPTGTEIWSARQFDAALDAQGGITVAVDVQIGAGATGRDVFVAGFNMDGSLRSAPVLASDTATGDQQHPVLLPLSDGTLLLQFMEDFGSGAPTALRGVVIGPADIIGPGVAFQLALNLPQGVSRDNVVFSFRSDDGQTEITATDTGNGYRFEISPAQATGLSGRIEITKDWTPGAGDPAITANDALDILRMAVGLNPSFGVPAVGNLIAADLNGDGQVDVNDALEALRAAVGLASATPPRWVFLDLDLDLSHINAGNVTYQTGIQVPDFSALGDLNLGGILLGHMAI